jgi:hypothetical protein
VPDGAAFEVAENLRKDLNSITGDGSIANPAKNLYNTLTRNGLTISQIAG